ncbi:unnamed protein product [Fraxinus pennsylvanica]|uniref:Uncharacterized protein n=1 Tax=Fraxinus pennsylvanica TaxID=56036 RepID=A0AAD1Z6C1_9LAMI|nr:unnamed protein product [Fraxinus pennsylvanica]
MGSSGLRHGGEELSVTLPAEEGVFIHNYIDKFKNNNRNPMKSGNNNNKDPMNLVGSDLKAKLLSNVSFGAHQVVEGVVVDLLKRSCCCGHGSCPFVVVPENHMLVALVSGPLDSLFGSSNLPAFTMGGVAAALGGILALKMLPGNDSAQ